MRLDDWGSMGVRAGGVNMNNIKSEDDDVRAEITRDGRTMGIA